MSDVTQVHKLLHGKEDTVTGDSGYTGADKREELQDVEAAFWIADGNRACLIAGCGFGTTGSLVTYTFLPGGIEHGSATSA